VIGRHFALFGAVVFGAMYFVGFMTGVGFWNGTLEARSKTNNPDGFRINQRIYAVLAAGLLLYFLLAH